MNFINILHLTTVPEDSNTTETDRTVHSNKINNKESIINFIDNIIKFILTIMTKNNRN